MVKQGISVFCVAQLYSVGSCRPDTCSSRLAAMVSSMQKAPVEACNSRCDGVTCLSVRCVYAKTKKLTHNLFAYSSPRSKSQEVLGGLQSYCTIKNADVVLHFS